MNVVIIGSGFGAYAMAPAYTRLGVEVEIVSPRDDEAVRRAIAAEPDLVSVHSPPFLHRRHVMLALEHGRAVLCDKPFGLNSGDARAMRDRACELGLPHFVNFELRFRPSRIKVGELLAHNAIGSLRHIHWMMFGTGLRQAPYGWLNDAEKGGGWIGAFGAHCIDAVSFWSGQSVARCGGVARTEISLRADRYGGSQPCSAEDAFSIWLELDDGATVNIDSGFSASIPFPERTLLFGEDGVIELIGDQSVHLHRAGLPAEHFAFPPSDSDSYAQANSAWLGAVCEALTAGTPAMPSFEDGVANAEVLDRLRAEITMARHTP